MLRKKQLLELVLILSLPAILVNPSMSDTPESSSSQNQELLTKPKDEIDSILRLVDLLNRDISYLTAAVTMRDSMLVTHAKIIDEMYLDSAHLREELRKKKREGLLFAILSLSVGAVYAWIASQYR